MRGRSPGRRSIQSGTSFTGSRTPLDGCHTVVIPPPGDARPASGPQCRSGWHRRDRVSTGCR
jgi:hypothetical protein